MKKRYLAIGLLTAASFTTYAQKKDSTYVKKKLSTTDVRVLFSYYTQDNDHSAVTGGIGTEDLQVYSTSVTVDQRRDSVRSFHAMAGVDLISSASTDNIDFEMSSASKTDFRAYLKAGVERKLGGSGLTAGISGSFSFESDYLSLGPGFFLSRVNGTQEREWTLAAQVYFDDLRWFDEFRYDGLIYPVELRYKDWFDIHRRTSYNLSYSLYQVINRRMSLGIFPGVAYQTGLLSTPFHRVYFTDDSRRVENLPRRRLRVPIGVQLSTFAGSRWILRLYYRFYWDNFGIRANTLSLESPVKVSRVVTFVPFIRVYRQSAADYFKPYGQHDANQEFYSSDYDLSQLESYKSGLGLRYAPFSKRGNMTFREMELRYAFYKRSDGLTANMVSLLIDWSFEKYDKPNGR